MSSPKLIRIVHKNDLSAYLGDWKNAMYLAYLTISRKNQSESQRYHITRIPTPIESFSFNSTDFSILLGYLDDRLRILEQVKIAPNQFSYQSYAEARVFLKTFFFFFRILLDDLSGIIGYFYKANRVIELPRSFDDLQKKAVKQSLPDDLQQILQPTLLWFSKMKDSRDDLVHHFDSILLSFKQGKGGKNIVGHFNIKGRSSYIEEDTRQHIGLLLCEYQKFIDNLLDHFDTKFGEWYGIIQGESGRTTSILQGSAGITLWWAYRYGNYRNDNLQVIESDNDMNKGNNG